MAKIPGPEALGKRPSPNPSTAVATLEPKSPSTPQLRTPIGANDDEARAQMRLGEAEISLGTGLEGLGADWQAKNEAEARRLEVAARHEQERQDTLRAEDAYTQLRNRQLDLTTGEGGYATLRGAAAVNQPILKTYTEQFENAAKEIAGGLANDEQRSLFARRAAVSGLQFKEGILHHVIRENDTYATDVFKGIVETETRAATANWASTPDVESSIARVNAAVATRAERGSWPAQYAESVRLKEVGDIHSAVIGEALASGNTAYAQQWFKDHQDEIDKPTAQKLERAVADGEQRQKVATYTSMFLQAHDSLPALAELERRVTADGGLDETRKNALLGQILGRRDTVNNALDRQDARNERAQERRERELTRAVDRVRGMLPYGEPTMQQLEPLINAAKGTPVEAEVRGLIATANATRQFRFATGLQQEALLGQLRAAARSDPPTRVDSQMLNTLQGIYDGQQRQLRESGIKFVVSQGLVRPDNPAVRPLDTSKPQSMAEVLPQRLQLARAVTDQYQAPMKPLTPEEKDLAVATLAAGSTAQRRDWFAQLAGAAGNDLRGYNAVVAQIAPDKPVLAIAGIAANRRYDDGQGKLVADLMLRGDEILNPAPRSDGKPDQGKLLPMPAEQKMRLDFDNHVRDAFAGNPQARSDYYQAARAIYAARSVDAGDKDTTVLDSNRWNEAMRLAMGPIENYNGRRTLLPWGMDLGKFKDGLSDRLNLLAGAGRLPQGLTPGKLRDLPLEPVGDGRYVFRSGDSVIVEPAPEPHPLARGLLAAPQNEAQWGKREDGSAKGRGFLGVLLRPDGGVSSELTVGVQVNGRQMDVPSLVPTLTRAEVETLLRLKEGERMPDSIIDKAAAFARERVKAGKSVFAEPGETPVPYASGARPIVIDFNQALPWVPSGQANRAAERPPTQAEIDAAASAARARVRPRQ